MVSDDKKTPARRSRGKKKAQKVADEPLSA